MPEHYYSSHTLNGLVDLDYNTDFAQKFFFNIKKSIKWKSTWMDYI